MNLSRRKTIIFLLLFYIPILSSLKKVRTFRVKGALFFGKGPYLFGKRSGSFLMRRRIMLCTGEQPYNVKKKSKGINKKNVN